MHGFFPVVGGGPWPAQLPAWAMRQSRMLARPGVNYEHQISIWCSHAVSLLCSVNDAVNVLPCSTCAYLNGRLS
jgi:hypothetical protein